jgi:hypothetical protein
MKGCTIVGRTPQGRDAIPIASVNHYSQEFRANARLLVHAKQLAALAALVACYDAGDLPDNVRWRKCADAALSLLRRLHIKD